MFHQNLDISNCISVHLLSVLDKACTELLLSRIDSPLCDIKFFGINVLKYVFTCLSIYAQKTSLIVLAFAQSLADPKPRQHGFLSQMFLVESKLALYGQANEPTVARLKTFYQFGFSQSWKSCLHQQMF